MPAQKITLVAYQLGEKINIHDFREAAKIRGQIYSSSVNDVFIKIGQNSYLSVQNTGEVAFADCDKETINELINLVRCYVYAPILEGREYKEDFEIEVDPTQKLKIEYNSIRLPEINPEVLKIAMLNISQSVALDYFTQISQDFLTHTTKFTQELEDSGRLRIHNKELMKFIGKTLNTQNRITENLYFIDAPDTVWENENLSQINNSLSQIFNLKTRFREVEYTLKIIDNNLRTFSQLVQHRDNKKMELTVIFLILFEVLNALISKFFR